MSGIILKFLVYLAVIVMVWMGVRRIWRDWTAQFRTIDKQRHERDLRERQRPDVIDLKRDGDGIYRAGGDENHRQ